MAAVDQANILTRAQSGTVASTQTTTATVAPNATIVAITFTFTTAAATASHTMSGGGLTWTRQHTVPSGTLRISIHTAPAPAGLASGTTLTHTAASSSDHTWVAASYVPSGGGTLSVVGFNGAAASTAAWATGNLGSLVNDLLVGGAGSDGSLLTTVVAGDNNERIDFNSATTSGSCCLYDDLVAEAGDQVEGTWSGAQAHVAIGIAIRESAGGATEPTQWRSPFSPAMRAIGRGPRGLVETRYPPETAAVLGTTYETDVAFTAGTVLDAPDVAEHAHAAVLVAGSSLSQARAVERPRTSALIAGTRLVAAKAVERPRTAVVTAGTVLSAPDVFTASETAAFTAGARLAAADVFTATDTATFTATTRLAAADVFEAAETATFVAGTTMTATAQAGFVAKAARFVTGTLAAVVKAVTTSRAATVVAGTLLRAVSASPIVQRTTRFTAGTTASAADATTHSRTATVTARAVVVGDDIFIATETATFRAGTTASGISQKTVAAISAKTATFTAGTQLAAVKAIETAAPIGHIDGTSATSAGVEDTTTVRHVESAFAGVGVDGTSNLAGVVE